MISKTLLAVIVALGVAGAHSAVAQTLEAASENVSVRIAYGDLDLGSPAGAKAMLYRIHTAARQICGEPTDAQEGGVQYRACVDKVMQRAVAKLGSPMVAAQNGMATGGAKVIVAASR
jgi:UrcA family protein